MCKDIFVQLPVTFKPFLVFFSVIRAEPMLTALAQCYHPPFVHSEEKTVVANMLLLCDEKDIVENIIFDIVLSNNCSYRTPDYPI